MGKIRGKGMVDALKLLFDTTSPAMMWTYKHNDGRLSVFAWANSLSNSISGVPHNEALVICCDIVLPAWDDSSTNKPMLLFNHASFYMKRLYDYERSRNNVEESVSKRDVCELDAKLWSHFQEEFFNEGFHDMAFGVNEHCCRKRSNLPHWYYRPTKAWDAHNANILFKSIKHLFDLMCDL